MIDLWGSVVVGRLFRRIQNLQKLFIAGLQRKRKIFIAGPQTVVQAIPPGVLFFPLFSVCFHFYRSETPALFRLIMFSFGIISIVLRFVFDSPRFPVLHFWHEDDHDLELGPSFYSVQGFEKRICRRSDPQFYIFFRFDHRSSAHHLMSIFFLLSFHRQVYSSPCCCS